MRLAIAACTAALLCVTAWAGPNEDALIAADKAFNEMAQTSGVPAAFEAFAAPDARMFRGQERIVSGPAEIRASMDAAYGAGGTLTWEPTEAVASEDGTLGFTRGRWVYTSPPADGKTSTSKGSYVTIWGKQPDGSYKFTLDIGETDQPAQ